MAKHGRKNLKPISAGQGADASDPRMGDLTVGDYANGVPNIRLSEMFKSMLRQMIWVLPLAVIGCGVAWYFTKDMKRTYTGNARVLVQQGEEYVYNPVGQSASGGGLTTTIDTITLTEAALMKNDDIIARVLGEMVSDPTIGEDRFDKKAYAKINSLPRNSIAKQNAIMELRNKVDKNYSVMPRPKSSIIDVQFTHEDPVVAVKTTNAFLKAYMDKRREVFVDGSSGLISTRRQAAEDQLSTNERAIARFLKKNDISDFESEQTGLRQRTENLKASLNATRASIAETEAALAEVEDQLRATPKTIDLYVDDRAAQRVSQAELELGQLLAKYLPTSDPVRQKQTELNELRALQNSYGGKATGGRRVGPNTTHQALTANRNTLASTADSLREREFTQQRQLNSADAKIRKLRELTPEYLNLLRERETLNTSLTSYNAKEQEALIDADQAEAKSENVQVISPAGFANKGRNTGKIMWLLGTVGWCIVLGFFALIRVFLDPKLYVNPVAVRRTVPEDLPMTDYDVPEMAPLHDPIPEPVPSYDPVAPVYPNPYDAQPAAAQLGVDANPYAQVDYQSDQPATASVPGYSPTTGYDAAAYVQFDQSGETYAMQNGAPNMAPHMSAAPLIDQAAQTYGTAQINTQPTGMAYQANAALDLSHNPYAAGNVQAGSLDEPVQYDQYGRPISPPVA